MNKKIIKIEAQKIYLRTLTEEDVSKKYCSWINDPEVNKYLDTKQATIEDLKSFVRERYNDSNCVFLGIFLKNSDIHIGNIKLDQIDFKDKVANIGILIGEKDYWSKGFATEALKTLINYAFNNLNLHEIRLNIYEQNFSARRAYEKSGLFVYAEDYYGEEKIYRMKIIRDLN